MLVDILLENPDMFAWSPSDMLGIPREVAEHSLENRADSKPVTQRLRRFDEEKRKIIGEEIHKLLAAGFIKEVVDAKLICKHKGLIPDSNVKACQPI